MPKAMWLSQAAIDGTAYPPSHAELQGRGWVWNEPRWCWYKINPNESDKKMCRRIASGFIIKSIRYRESK